LAWQRSSPRRDLGAGARSRCNVFRKKMSIPDEDVFPECGKAYAAVYMMRFEPEGSELRVQKCVADRDRSPVEEDEAGKLKTPDRRFEADPESMSVAKSCITASTVRAPVS
jgi:hypothetical protein